ncbi:PepSY domain-containing protein [Streptomyces sp. NBC_01511]|uniref:PepSY domain-containing protein n=1 Tax=Streptomyces sp. NBC_01511 TaxID=2903889 RepID=UPI00386D88A3
MKRNLVIASITAAALIGGGTYTAVAMGATDSGSDTAPKTVSSASLVNASNDDRDDRDDRDDDKDDTSGAGSAAGSKLTADQVAAAALKQHPGTVESVELDDDGDDDGGSSAARHWEVDIIGQDGKWYDLRVDSSTGSVRADNDSDDDGDDDRDDRDERTAVRGAAVDAREAAAAALKKHSGAVTSVDADTDGKADHWEVTVRGDDGRAHEVTVDMSSGKVAADRDDRDDHGDDGRDDDGHDDRGDDDGDDN